VVCFVVHSMGRVLLAFFPEYVRLLFKFRFLIAFFDIRRASLHCELICAATGTFLQLRAVTW
jgi:hypothetical protein